MAEEFDMATLDRIWDSIGCYDGDMHSNDSDDSSNKMTYIPNIKREGQLDESEKKEEHQLPFPNDADTNVSETRAKNERDEQAIAHFEQPGANGACNVEYLIRSGNMHKCEGSDSVFNKEESDGKSAETIRLEHDDPIEECKNQPLNDEEKFSVTNINIFLHWCVVRLT